MSASVAGNGGNTDKIDESLSIVGTITEESAKLLDNGSKAVRFVNKHLTIQAATRAFRGFEMKSVTEVLPTLNRFGTLQGMVTSAKWRHVFSVSIRYANQIERVAKMADYLAWANYIIDWGAEIDSVVKSPEPWDVKGQKLCFYPTAALAKTLIGTAHGLTDLTIYSAQAACSVCGALNIKGMPSVSQCSSYGAVLRASVGVGFKKEEEFFSIDNIKAGVTAVDMKLIDGTMNIYDTTKSFFTHILK